MNLRSQEHYLTDQLLGRIGNDALGSAVKSAGSARPTARSGRSSLTKPPRVEQTCGNDLGAHKPRRVRTARRLADAHQLFPAGGVQRLERLQDFRQSEVRALVQPAQPERASSTARTLDTQEARVMRRSGCEREGWSRTSGPDLCASSRLTLASVATQGGCRRGVLRKTGPALATFSQGDGPC